jgi:hypothetical protein
MFEKTIAKEKERERKERERGRERGFALEAEGMS